MENISNFADESISSNIKPFMDFKETFKRYGQTISSIAKAMGKEQSSLSRSIINNTIQIKELQQMAEICGVTLEEFIGVPNEVKLVINDKEYTYEFKKK